jgi:hypothetical protein
MIGSKMSRQTKIGALRLFAGLLALSAEAMVMAALMTMAGICALGSIVGGLIASRPTRPHAETSARPIAGNDNLVNLG